jgi:cyclopropane-fatty-acyl-phospholipid synthase
MQGLPFQACKLQEKPEYSQTSLTPPEPQHAYAERRFNMTSTQDLLLLTPQNVAQITRDLPFAMRKAMGLAALLQKGTLTIGLTDGRMLIARGSEPGPDATLIIKDYSFASRLSEGGDIGFAEAYLRGEWETPDLTKFLEVFAANYPLIEQLLPGRPLVKLWQRFRHFMNRNSKKGSRRNIHAHYDLGNAFYAKWLDRTMTYSSAIYAPGDNDLATAQTRKYAALADQLGLTADDHVLEIGCGWGGFAEYAATRHGCRVTGLTISQEQFDFAQARIIKAGLSDRVTFKLQDYRDERGTYDKIVSIEMFEAVGEAFWPDYFQTLSACLKPGGAAGLQVITIRDESFQNYKREIDFIRAYIFPGGMLPTPTIMAGLGQRFGLPLAHDRNFGLDYARTLAQWRDSFHAAWPQIVPLGFDERFRRMWDYYLSYCEAGFRTGNIDVRQMIFAKT